MGFKIMKLGTLLFTVVILTGCVSTASDPIFSGSKPIIDKKGVATVELIKDVIGQKIYYFPISEIKSFYYFDIGRGDIILKDNRVIKLPVKNFSKSLKNYLELNKKINFEKYSIFDYRIQDQLILN